MPKHPWRHLRLAYRLAMVEPYGFIILLALLFTQTLGLILAPFYNGALTAVVALFNLR